MEQLVIGVLMGGASLEREVSLNSGRTICDHLDTARYTVVPLFQTVNHDLFILPDRFLHRGKIADFEQRLTQEAEKITWDALKKRVDFIYIAQHGRMGEDGTLQGMLEVLGIPYFGSKVLASALGMNKALQKKLLQSAGIQVPRGIVLKKSQLQEILATQILPEKIQKQCEQLSYPLVIKPAQEGSSFGVSIIEQSEQLCKALVTASTITPHVLQDVIIEEKMSGMEFTCIVIEHAKTGELEALPATEIVPETTAPLFDYEQKYMPGRAEKHTPARCPENIMRAIQETCIRVMKILGMQRLGRIDGFVTRDNSIVIIDPNTFSGMAPSSFTFVQAAQKNMSLTDFINHLIATEIRYYAMNTHFLTDHKKDSAPRSISPKIRVAVLLGGPSNEREISLESGRNITYKLSPQKYSALPLFVTKDMRLFAISHKQLVLNSTKEISDSLQPEQEILWSALPNFADFVFIGLHGGPGENGSVQGTLEMLRMPYNGSSVLASALCMNKFTTNRLLEAEGFDVPRGYLVEKEQWHTTTMNDILAIAGNFPLIVKPHDDGCSVMVQKVNNETELCNAIEIIFAQEKRSVLIEECIHGMELTVGVIGNDTAQALPPSQAVTTTDILSIEEKFLPGAGENQTPAPLPAEQLIFVQRTIERVYETVGCRGYARIDCFYQNALQSSTGKERVIIIEINTLPGMTPATCIFHQAAEIGIKPMDFIDKIITLGQEAHSAYHNAHYSKQAQEVQSP